MDDKYYAWEMLKISFGRYLTVIHQDKLLSDYAKGFSGPRDETGLKDAGPPRWWVEQWYKLEKQAHKDDGATNISGNIFQFDAETGNLTIKGHMGAIQIMKEDVLKVVSFLMKGPPPDVAQPNLSPSNPGGQNAYEFSPQLKERHDRNWDTIEKLAKASSKAYPKG